MYEIPVDMTPEQLEAVKQLQECFKPISQGEFLEYENRAKRRAREARERRGGRPEKQQTHSVLTTGGRITVGCNQSCPCGSGKKYKNCCGIGA